MPPSEHASRTSSSRTRYAALATLVIAAAATVVVGRQALRFRGTAVGADGANGALVASVDAMDRDEIARSHADVDSPDATPPSEPYDNPEDVEPQAAWEVPPPPAAL